MNKYDSCKILMSLVNYPVILLMLMSILLLIFLYCLIYFVVIKGNYTDIVAIICFVVSLLIVVSALFYQYENVSEYHNDIHTENTEINMNKKRINRINKRIRGDESYKRKASSILLAFSRNRYHKRVRFLIIPGVKNKFLVFNVNFNKRIPKKIFLQLYNSKFYIMPINKYSKHFNRFLSPLYDRKRHSNSFLNKYIAIQKDIYPPFLKMPGVELQVKVNKVYLSKLGTRHYFNQSKLYIRKNISHLYKYRNKIKQRKDGLIYKKKHDIIKYINLCNFKVFEYLLVALVIAYLMSLLLLLYKVFLIEYAHVYRLNVTNMVGMFLNDFWEVIFNGYIFRMVPLLIAVMSGVMVIYSHNIVSSPFKLLIKYTIPVLSSVQFIKLFNKFCKKFISLFKEY